MNERIQQLAEQAGMYVDLNGNPWPKCMSAEECEVAYKKFADLILTEVIDILATYRGRVIFEDGFEYNCQHPIYAIRDHFGLKKP